MGIREVGWLIFLAGLPFAPFLFRPHLDIWHSHTYWAQGWVIGLWTLGLFQGFKVSANKPLAVWWGWICAWCLWTWISMLKAQKVYAIGLLAPWGHLLVLVLFYQAATSQWNSKLLERLLFGIGVSGCVVLAYCGLQLLSLDQFFVDLDKSKVGHDLLVGTIGNPTHLGAYLSFLLPVYLFQRNRLWLIAAAVTLIFIALTVSATAWLGAGIVMAYWLLHFGYGWVKPSLLVGIALLAAIGYWAWCHTNWFNPYGRFRAWTAFWDIFKSKQSITGLGPGYIMQQSQVIKDSASPIFQWRHAHNEYFQIMIEQGIIGFGLVGWILIDAVKRAFSIPSGPLKSTLIAIGFAFLINCLLSFPAHLWLLGSFGLIAYCGIHVLANEVTLNGPNYI